MEYLHLSRPITTIRRVLLSSTAVRSPLVKLPSIVGQTLYGRRTNLHANRPPSQRTKQPSSMSIPPRMRLHLSLQASSMGLQRSHPCRRRLVRSLDTVTSIPILVSGRMRKIKKEACLRARVSTVTQRASPSIRHLLRSTSTR